MTTQELQKALEKYGTAAKLFAALSASHKQEYLKWVNEAKKEETRQKRIEKTAKMLRREIKNEELRSKSQISNHKT
jgi:uncharacterized protein YdeI (YjbR/CyaY-like superfamily)